MRERNFIDQNKSKWADFEKELKNKSPKPNKIAQHYIETTDDLSFARTHYPNRLVRSYLNGLAEILSLKIQKGQNTYLTFIIDFWRKDLPLTMFQARKALLISFLLFVISMLIGVFSTLHDSTFPEYILSPEYIKMTEENIAKGDPMAVYKDHDEVSMFLGITYNNILVSVRAYVGGLFAGLGTVFILIYNGIMLGAFQFYFYQQGLFTDSFLTIWQHGVVEISCIILAGAAGLVLAQGLLFPGTLSRLNAFRISGRKSIIIMLGLMPLLVYSGFIEGFATRYTDLPDAVRWSTIILSISFVLIYFVWLPLRLSKKYNWQAEHIKYIQPIYASTFSYHKIENNIAVSWETLRALSTQRKMVIGTTLALGVLLTALCWFIYYDTGTRSLHTQVSQIKLGQFFNSYQNPLITISNLCILLVSATVSQQIISKHTRYKGISSASVKNYRPAIISSVLSVSIILTSAFLQHFFLLIAIPLLPFTGMLIAVSYREGSNGLPFNKTLDYLKKGYFKILLFSLAAAFIMVLITVVINLFISEYINGFITGFLGSGKHFYMFSILLSTFVSISLVYTFFLFFFTACGVSYFSFKEVKGATQLKQAIAVAFPVDEDKNTTASLLQNTRFTNP